MWHSEGICDKFQNICDKMVQMIINSGIKYESIGVFGSYARGDYTLASDIDICVITPIMPDRAIKGFLYDEAEDLGVDLCFITPDRFMQEDSLFMNNLRRDYKEVAKNVGE